MKKYLKLRTVPLTIHEKIIVASMMLMATQCQAFSAPGLTGLGCEIIKWMTGELSVVIFFLIVVITLLVGFFAKMDWTKILGVVVLFGLMKGLGSLFGTWITSATGCLNSAF